jgi:hypothetical protein
MNYLLELVVDGLGGELYAISGSYEFPAGGAGTQTTGVFEG